MSSPVKLPYHPELEAILAHLPAFPLFTKEGMTETRNFFAPLGDAAQESIAASTEISHEEVTIPVNGAEIILSIFAPTKPATKPRPGVYYIHGGGMILGTRWMAAASALPWAQEIDAVTVSVEYRLAPEHCDPTLVEDCYAGLKWVSENLSKLNIDPEKLMIAGASAGGGLAAGTALMARDRGGPKLCAQLLIYPMLDDRMSTVSSKQYENEGVWNGQHNIIAWDWYLGSGKRGKEGVSIYAVPARAKDLSGLPTTYIEVGSCDLFRDEDVDFASKLWEQGTQAELHVWPGAWHGYDAFAPDTKITKAALEARMRWVKDTLLG